MTVPDFRHGFLRIPLAVWHQVFCRTSLTRRQLQIVALIVRESWGWQTPDGGVRLWTRPLAARQIAAGTGLSTDHLHQDLRRLVARGVLLESDGRYHFVADPGLWKTSASPSHDLRREAQNIPTSAAKNASLAPVAKKGIDRKRNVPPAPVRELSTGGENPALLLTFGAGHHARSAFARTDAAGDRFLEVIAAFAGPLAPVQRMQMAAWIRSTGIAAVWRSLQQAHRQGPAAVRRWLTAATDPASRSATDPDERDASGRQ